jgi:membrane associated rhomboid family serine protease
MDELPPSEPKTIRIPPVPLRLPLPLVGPLFSWVILILNAIVWLLMTLSGGSTDPNVLVRFGAKVPWLVASGEYWRLFTAIFLHIGFLHLAFNSYALYSLGPQVESLFGRGRFLVIYFLSGLAGSVASYVMAQSVSAGASGAIFGLIGALAVYLVRHHNLLGRRGQRALNNIVVVILYNLILSFIVPGIDALGHLGGLAGGLIVGRLLCPRYEIVLDQGGMARLVDCNSLKRQAGWLVLVGVALMAGAGLGTLRWKGLASVRFIPGVVLLGQLDVALARGGFELAPARGPGRADAVVGRRVQRPLPGVGLCDIMEPDEKVGFEFLGQPCLGGISCARKESGNLSSLARGIPDSQRGCGKRWTVF